MIEYFKKWREIGTVIYDPQGAEGAEDTELYFALVFKAIDLDDMNLATAILAARNFGLSIKPSPKYGYRLEGIQEQYKDYFTKRFSESKYNLLKIMKELSEECSPQTIKAPAWDV